MKKGINKKILLILIIVTYVATYNTIPDYLYSGGGSCYQGISAVFSIFFLTICSVINLIALTLLHYKKGKTTVKILSIISLLIWSLSLTTLESEALFSGLLHFTPFFFTTLLLVLYSFSWFKQDSNK